MANSAARSGNPAKRATAKKTVAKKTAAAPTSASAWNAAAATNEEPLTLPSGFVALVRRPGPEALLQNLVMADTLGPIVQDAIEGKKGIKKKVMDQWSNDPKAIAEMMDTVDNVCAAVVVQPKLLWHKRPKEDADNTGSVALEVIPPEERLGFNEAVYTDAVSLPDKMHIFQFAIGGTRAWERFRSEAGVAVGSMGDLEVAQDPSE